MNKNNPKILLVEDEPDICHYMQEFFRRRGFRTSTTASGTEALSLISKAKPDVIILDFTLQDLDGREVLKRLRAHDKETKVIVTTGQLFSEEEIEKIKALGVSEYFHKPISLEKLVGVIYKITGKPVSHPVIKVKKHPEKQVSLSSGTHKLSNLLGIIRNRCENFTLNMSDGIYNDKSREDLAKISVDIMTDVMETVDEAAGVIKKMKHGKEESSHGKTTDHR